MTIVALERVEERKSSQHAVVECGRHGRREHSSDITRNLRDQDPALKTDPVKAAMNVYTKEIIVETVARFCAKQAPQFAPRVQAAHDEWMQRHAILRQKKIVVLHDKLSDSELVALARQMEQENEAVLRTIQQAPLEERQKWCADAPGKFSASEFNLAGNRDLVDALVDYKVKPKN